VTLRIVIADDQSLVRAGFRLILDSVPEIEVVGEAMNGTEAVWLAESEQPDVVLMDIRMPEMDGIEATRIIKNSDKLSDVKVLILTTFDLDTYVFDALRAGASGFLLKDTEPRDLIDAVKVVARGDALLAPELTRRLIAEFVAQPERKASSPKQLDVLTEREREVLGLTARGLSNQEIADNMVVSMATVKTHISRILDKLDARDRAQLVVIAYESGLVHPRTVADS
jgi:DNA-binding NarL/FixJ family response regulator